jgi:hypothetical protein
MNRFSLLVYDSVCGAKQKALREVFLGLENSVLMNINRPADIKAMSTVAWDNAFRYADTHFTATRGYQRGKDALQMAFGIYMNTNNAELCLDSLELGYMWLGKSIRDEQLKRVGKAVV